jgi:hypothetical protein
LNKVLCVVKSTKLDTTMFHAFVVLFLSKVSYFLHNKKHGKSMKLGCVKSMKLDMTKACICDEKGAF